MPIQPCTKDGKSGYKYGNSGTCYTGPGARAKAAKQGRAIEMNKHNKTKSNFIEEFFKNLSKIKGKNE